MIYRALDTDGDYTFGKGSGNFFHDIAAAPAQACKTRLRLIRGEWFLDITNGTPYNSQILGAGMVSIYDEAIKSVILNTPGVTGIIAYASQVEPSTRKASVSCTISTKYGQAVIKQIFG